MSREEEVLAAARELVEAFGRHDTRAYFGAFAPARRAPYGSVRRSCSSVPGGGGSPFTNTSRPRRSPDAHDEEVA
jgi:hypothetical protein